MKKRSGSKKWPIIIPIPVNKKEIILAKCFEPGWSGITHQKNNEACKQDQGAKRETDLAQKQIKKKLQDKRETVLLCTEKKVMLRLQVIAYNTT